MFSMKSTKFAAPVAVALALIATAGQARTDKSVATPTPNGEAIALRKECAARNEVRQPAPAADGSEYTFVYYKGEYRGEHVAGLQLDCTDAQFTAFLETADPVRVMNAYPTAAGRPAPRRAVAR